MCFGGADISCADFWESCFAVGDHVDVAFAEDAYRGELESVKEIEDGVYESLPLDYAQYRSMYVTLPLALLPLFWDAILVPHTYSGPRFLFFFLPASLLSFASSFVLSSCLSFFSLLLSLFVTFYVVIFLSHFLLYLSPLLFSLPLRVCT